jgi:hypothetical protein
MWETQLFKAERKAAQAILRDLECLRLGSGLNPQRKSILDSGFWILDSS